MTKMADIQTHNGDDAAENGGIQEALDAQKEFDAKIPDESVQYLADEPEENEDEKETPKGYDIEDDDAVEDADDKDAGDDDEEQEKAHGKSEEKSASKEISEELVKRAVKLGFDPEEAQSFKNPETLERVLAAIEGREQAGVKKPEGKTAEQDESENPFEYKIELDADEYDLEDGLGGELSKMNKHYSRVISSLVEKLTELASERYTERFDAAIEGLGKEWSQVFGEGSISDIERDSDYFKARQKLAREVETIQQGRAKLGRPPLPLKEAVRWALRGAFEKEMGRIEKEKERQASKQRRKQTLARPSNYPGRLNPNINYELYKIQEEFDRKIAEGGY